MHVPITSAHRRIATIGALALTVLGLSVSPASAGSDEHINTDGGSAHFYAGGTEQLFVSDIRADGEGVSIDVLECYTVTGKLAKASDEYARAANIWLEWKQDIYDDRDIEDIPTDRHWSKASD